MTTTKQLTERQAWLKIREAFSEKNLVRPADCGLCGAVNDMRWGGLINWSTALDMKRRIYLVKPRRGCYGDSYYWALKSRGPDRARIRAINWILRSLP